MPGCGNCAHKAVAPAAPLLQIRHGYRAQWNGLAFAVENDASDWTLRVENSNGPATLYTARRSKVDAAQFAAADFAIFSVLGGDSRVSPERLAKELNWQEYW